MARSTKEDKSLAPLKFMVFSLGLALIGGIILMFVMVYQRHQAKMEGNLPSKQMEASLARCPGGNLKLNGGGSMKSVEFKNDNIVAVVTEQADRSTVTVIDYCANRVINRIELR